MKTLIKICGLTNQESVDVAVQSGADLIGFVFAKKSPRCISPELASQLSGSIPAQVKTTAVMLHPSDAEAQEVFDRFLPDYLQTDAKDFESLHLPEGCCPLKVYRDRPQLHFNEIDPNELSLFDSDGTTPFVQGSGGWNAGILYWSGSFRDWSLAATSTATPLPGVTYDF